jgi:PAS domain S-box-containing protein
MNLLDMRTVLLGNVVSNAICAAVMTALWLMNRKRYAGLDFLQAGFVMQFLASFLLAFRGLVPVRPSIVLSSLFVVVGVFLIYRGLEHFTGRISSKRCNYLLLAGVFGVYVYFMLAPTSMAARAIAFSLEVLVLCSMSAWLMLCRVDAQMRPATRLVGVVFCAFSLLCLASLIADLAVPPVSDLFNIGTHDVLVVLACQMLFIGLTFSLSLMLNHRLVATLERDIEGRKNAEESLRESRRTLLGLLSNLPGMAYRCRNDRDWTMEFVSEGALALTGYKVEELVGSAHISYGQVVHADDREKVWQGVNEAVREHRSFQLSYRIVTSGGVEKWVWEQGGGVFSEKGELLEVEGFITDISDRKRLEAEKAKYEAQNLQLQKAESLGRMAGAIAHQYNNLLGVVLGNLELSMAERPRETADSEYLAEASKAARRAAEVSGLMLTYLGQARGKLEPLDLSEACRKSLSSLRGVLPDKVELKAGLPSAGPIIKADSHQIQQVLTNLTTNAWEALEESGGAIDLTVKTVSQAEIPAPHRFPLDWQPQEELYACVEARDTGGGIAEKDIEKIFDPFFTSKFTGRGLGLPVVLGIVRTHLGGITVESKEGHGSVFRVFFPLALETVPQRPAKAAKAPEVDDSGTVLVVEDDEAVRKVAMVVLARLGHSVLEARDGFEALEVFQRHKAVIRLVLCDLTMPRMDGWATLTALRKFSPGIPVILASGCDQAQVMAGDHDEWPQAFLAKPYQSKQLREAIRQALEVTLGGTNHGTDSARLWH